MKCVTTLIFSFIFSFGWAQNQHEGIIVDTESKEPIEFVGIYNGKDHTMSNADGRYSFSSSQDSVLFYRIGYNKLKTTFSQLQDTLFLKKSPYELDEVVVTNAKTLWQKVGDSIKTNYVFTPYKEKFLLRGILKYNDTIVRIQDIQGKLQRKTLLYTKELELSPKDYVVEFINMRKIGIVNDENDVYFKFPTLYGLFSSFIRLNATGEGFILTEKPYKDNDKVRYEFISDPEHKTIDISGYYVINTLNNAIEEFHVTSTAPKNKPYTKKRWLKYRTTYYELTVLFEKNLIKNRYYMRSAKSNEKVEVTDKKNSFNEKYDINFILNTTDSFDNFKVKKNISATKDIFKLKYPYNSEYWSSQNQLLLTDEMQAFIKKMGKDNKEFKVRSNIDYK